MIFRRNKPGEQTDPVSHSLRGRVEDTLDNPLARRVRAVEEPGTLDLETMPEDDADQVHEPPTRDLSGDGTTHEPVVEPICGLLVVLDGPLRGTMQAIFQGENQIAESSEVVHYDSSSRQFQWLAAADARVLNTGDELLANGVTYRFIAICGPGFSW